MKVVGYIRCSTENSEDSPQVQQSAIEQYCEREKHELVRIYTDYGVSGGLPLLDRPEAGRMLAEAPGLGISAIVALRLERFSRNLYDLIGFIDAVGRHKLTLLFVTESYADDASGRMMLQVTGVIAEYYRKLAGQRIREHHRYKAARGEWAGGYAPLGYKWDKDTKTLAIDESRADDAIAVFQTFVNCNGSAGATARVLNAQGITTAKGSRWQASHLLRIIANPVYARCVHFGDVVTPTELIPELIPADMVGQAATMFAQREKTPMTKQYDFAFSRLITCSKCGSKFFRKVRCKDTLGGLWACTGVRHKECNASHIGVTRLDSMVCEAVLYIIDHVRDSIPDVTQRRRRKVKPVDFEARRKRVIDLYEEGVISKDDMLDRLSKLQPATEPAEDMQPIIPPHVLRDIINNSRELWGDMTEVEKRKLVMMLTSDMRLTSGKPALLEVDTSYVPYTIRVVSTSRFKVWLE